MRFDSTPGGGSVNGVVARTVSLSLSQKLPAMAKTEIEDYATNYTDVPGLKYKRKTDLEALDPAGECNHNSVIKYPTEEYINDVGASMLCHSY